MRLILPSLTVILFLGNVYAAENGASPFDKYRRANEAAGMKIKEATTRNLQAAEALRTSDPDEAVRLLRKNLHELEDDIGLSPSERNRLLRAVESSLREVEELAAAKRLEERMRQESMVTPEPLDDKSGRLKVAQAAAGAFQVTPVVSGDRRYVRIGVNGIFTSMTPGPVFGPPGFSTLGLNTTVSAPVGGSVVVGGFTTSASARYSSGVPILGHIPYVGRLFNNVGYGSVSNSTQVIVSPRVIVLER